MGGKRSRKGTVMLYVDGASEKEYIRRLCRIYNGYRVRTNDRFNRRVSKCVKDMKLNGIDPKKGDLAAIVTDVDASTREELLELEAECRRAGIELYLSNPSFEVWLLLHHEIPRGDVSQKGMEHRLSVLLGREYRKSDSIPLTEEGVEAAIRNARKLLPDAGLVECMVTCPSTMMHLLVGEIVA